MKKIVIAALAVLTILGVSLAYFVLQPPNTVQITFAGVNLNVELATTPSQQEKGLSDRDSMPLDHGMLFIFSSQGYWGFWMHGMRFPLDIIWFNSNRQVVWIEPNLPPCNPTNCYEVTPETRSMYVLEVNAGFVTAHHIKLGTTFILLDKS